MRYALGFVLAALFFFFFNLFWPTKENNINTVGVEPSGEFLEFVRNNGFEAYKDLEEVKGKFDRILNVGMLEHVHPKYYDTFFKKISELMKDDSICLTHTIGSSNAPGYTNAFINKYIFVIINFIFNLNNL